MFEHVKHEKKQKVVGKRGGGKGRGLLWFECFYCINMKSFMSRLQKCFQRNLKEISDQIHIT